MFLDQVRISVKNQLGASIYNIWNFRLHCAHSKKDRLFSSRKFFLRKHKIFLSLEGVSQLEIPVQSDEI